MNLARISRIPRPQLVIGIASALAAATAIAIACLPNQAVARSAHAAAAHEVITSLSVTGYPLPATPTFTIKGSALGAAPTGGISPEALSNCGKGETGLDYAAGKLVALNGSRSDGLLGAAEYGSYFTKTYGNCGGIVVKKFTSTEIVFSLGTGYEVDGVSLKSGDTVCVMVKGFPACVKLP